MRAALIPSFKLNDSQRPDLQIPLPWGLGIQHINLGRRDIQSIYHPFQESLNNVLIKKEEKW